MILETVAGETPAIFAMSRIVKSISCSLLKKLAAL
jgi:hypothetical protein